MELETLVEKLNSPYDEDETVGRLIACGPAAIVPLERFLFLSKPSVVYQPRRAAVEVLGALGAKDVLTKYLIREKNIADPAIRFAEQAVENAAARELARFRSADVLETLLKMALPHPRPGIVEALGQFACLDAIPYFIRGLGDDFCRSAAEDALRTLGRQAELALVSASRAALPSPEEEGPSSKQRRTRSLELLAELVPLPESWPVLRCHLTDPEPGIVVAISKIAVKLGDAQDRIIAVDRLLEVLPGADWFLREEIQSCLVDFYPGARSRIEEEITRKMALPEAERVMDSSLRTLLGVRRRMNASAPQESIPN